MARQKGGNLSVSLNHSEEASEDVPVTTCPGWREECPFCDKRFGAWTEVDEETMDKIPTLPGFVMIALRNKSETEVVDIALDVQNVQKIAGERLDLVKGRVADKKSKFTKSTILARWMTFKQTTEKDVSTLCAHWVNCGVMPRFTKPQNSLHKHLEENTHYTFSEDLQKWCLPKKNAFWRKPKTLPTKMLEMVEACDWFRQCQMCDSSFSKWMSLDDVLLNGKAPDQKGIYMLSVMHSGQREVVFIGYDHNDIKFNIKSAIENNKRWLKDVSHNKKFSNHSVSLQLRWMEMPLVESENSCVILAHFLNAKSLPMLNFELPGENILEMSKNFVQRSPDKRWCYGLDLYRQPKNSKTKNRKQLLAELMQDCELEEET